LGKATPEELLVEDFFAGQPPIFRQGTLTMRFQMPNIRLNVRTSPQ
jgi:hypothetical protein